ncbi:hypothetical protein BDK51DRAFT_47321 [Blyttiomyces helicus]|uniref:Pectinesterase inhibitor domain-containing protein n=1 Tax=Blyttiomyces helicus TaxID=388810 RepID=A0A4P9WFJ2_9FUNG|nr:hypothetical protein BDK51DRAFT_47321 [Blyttiomyces helicus]|eukprot:RKO90078.1 hypothetical protein BDK51DRAFT_47321 [Blyttiomyces helicus]
MLPTTFLFAASLTSAIAAPTGHRRPQPTANTQLTFAEIDITKLRLSGNESLHLAQDLCNRDRGLEFLESAHTLAKQVQADTFDPAIKAAGFDAQKLGSVKCESIRNKIRSLSDLTLLSIHIIGCISQLVKDTCLVNSLAISRSNVTLQTQKLAEIRQNVVEINRICKTVDAIFFVDAGATTLSNTTTTTITTVATSLSTSTTSNTSTTTVTAFPATSISQIDISRTTLTGAQARSLSQTICPASASVKSLRNNANLCEQFEKAVIDPALKAAKASKDKKKINTLVCQLNRNKILKNTCVQHADETEEKTKKSSAAELQKKIKAISHNIQLVDSLCPGAVAEDFVLPTDLSSTSTLNPTSTSTSTSTSISNSTSTSTSTSSISTATSTSTSTNTSTSPTVTTTTGSSKLTISFASIDISRKSLIGTAAKAAVEAICPPTASVALLSASHDVAERAEVKVFQPAIKAAKDAATLKALKCQLNRNKLLKNQCTINRLQITQDNPTLLAEKLKAIVANQAGTVKFCTGADTSRFIDAAL